MVVKSAPKRFAFFQYILTVPLRAWSQEGTTKNNVLPTRKIEAFCHIYVKLLVYLAWWNLSSAYTFSWCKQRFSGGLGICCLRCGLNPPIPLLSFPHPITVWWHHDGENVIMAFSLVSSVLNLMSQSLTATHSRRVLITSAFPPCSPFSSLRFISLRLVFLPSSLFLSLQVYWKHFSSCLWQARQMKNKFQMWSECLFNLWLCFLLGNTVALPCTAVRVMWACTRMPFWVRFCWIFALKNVPVYVKACLYFCVCLCKLECLQDGVKGCQDTYINLNVSHIGLKSGMVVNW